MIWKVLALGMIPVGLFALSKWLNTARIKYQDMDYDYTKYACESGISEGERHHELYGMLGGCEIHFGNYLAAATALDSAFAIDSVKTVEWMEKKGGFTYYYQAYYFAARELYEQAQYEHSLTLLRRSSLMAPDDIPTLVLKAAVLHQLDRKDEANAIYMDILENDPDNPDVNFLIGKALFDAQSFDSCITYYSAALKFYKEDYSRKMLVLFKNVPDSPTSLKQKVYTLWQQQDLDSLDKVLMNELLLESGVQAYGKALEHYVKVSIDLARSYYYIGMAYYYSKNDSLALVNLKSSLKYRPDDPDALFFTGEILVRSKEYTDAIPYLKYLTYISPEDVYGWFYLGVCYMQLKEYDKAIDMFENHVLQLKPDHVDAMTNLAFVYNEKGDTKKANEYLQRAKELQE